MPVLPPKVSLPWLPIGPLELLPALVVDAGAHAQLRFLEFFTAQIRNPHTRRAYARAVGEFLAGCRR